MMRPGKSKIETYLIKSEQALKNAVQAPEIFALLEPRGYNSERLDAGWALHKEAYRLLREQELRYGDQYEAGEAFRRLRKQAKNRYSELRRLARIALRGDAGLFKALALDERPGQSLSAWLAHARQFLDNALADEPILEKLARVGVSPETLTETRELTRQVEKAADTHEAAKGRAIKATEERNQAFSDFRLWMYDFRQVCRVALAPSPQLLEKLGIKA
jgi:hypothetical protein